MSLRLFLFFHLNEGDITFVNVVFGQLRYGFLKLLGQFLVRWQCSFLANSCKFLYSADSVFKIIELLSHF